ncbi:MAG: tyrosine-type recombinase/integrase [Anaerostipes sp.]|uniref:tyrosine-type recombinase/integrase n=1 Tax=Anaerostipes sp. TaxID=1872530 RepID=UPI0039931587
MTYKQEFQNQNAKKLQSKFEEYAVPDFIRGYFFTLKSDYNRLVTFYKLNKFFKWLMVKAYVKAKDISELSPDDFDRLKMNHIAEYLECLRIGSDALGVCSVNTLCSIKNSLSSFWSYLERNDYVETNVVQKISRSSYRLEYENKITVLSDNDISELLSNIRKSGIRKNDFCVARNVAIVKLLLGSGVRITELIGLDICDIHLDENFPYINVVLKGDTYKKKSVFISNTAKEAMRNYLDARNEYLCGADCDAIFVSNRKKRITKANVEDMIKRYSKGKFTPHNMRDTVGTRIYAKNKDIKAAQMQLNHASPDTTSKYYIAYTQQMVAATIIDL